MVASKALQDFLGPASTRTQKYSRVPENPKLKIMSLSGSVSIAELPSQGADSDAGLRALEGDKAGMGGGWSGLPVLLPSE